MPEAPRENSESHGSFDDGGAGSVHMIARGLVQGVGFRFFVERVGVSLGLSGYVRNLPDGTVEVEAEGDRRFLEELVRQVREGPRGSRVSSLDVGWGELRGEIEGFHIRF